MTRISGAILLTIRPFSHQQMIEPEGNDFFRSATRFAFRRRRINLLQPKSEYPTLSTLFFSTTFYSSHILMYFAAVAGMQYTLDFDMEEHPSGIGLSQIANNQVWVALVVSI